MQMREEAEAERMEHDEQERRDWFEMMQSEAAFRVFLGLLDEMGENRVMVTENDMRMRNMADQILDRIAKANPNAVRPVNVGIEKYLGGLQMDDPIVGGQEQVQEPTGVVDAPSDNGGSASEAPAGTQETVQSSESSDWRASLPEGWADKLKDVESADDAMKALERGLGYKPAEKAEDIELKYPESFKGKVDEGVEAGFRELLRQTGHHAGAGSGFARLATRRGQGNQGQAHRRRDEYVARNVGFSV